MTARGETRRRVLGAAGELFQRQGYAATGVRQVLDAAGATKGVFSHHFPDGKEQLATESLAESGETIARFLELTLARSPTAAEALLAFAAALASGLRASDFQRGCPLATVALDGGSSARIAATCDRSFDRWQELLARALERDGHSAAAAAELALLAVGALEGGLVLARAKRRTAPLEQLAATIAERLRPPR